MERSSLYINRKKTKKNKQSLLWKIYRWILAIAVADGLMLVVFSVFSAVTVRREARQNYENAMEVMRNDIDTELANTVSFISAFLNETDTQKMLYMSGETYFSKKREQETLDIGLQGDEYVTGVWVSSSVTGEELVERSLEKEDYAEYQKFRQMFLENEAWRSYPPGRWLVVEVQESPYLVYFQYDADTCISAWVNVKRILKRAPLFLGDGEASLTFVGSDEEASEKENERRADIHISKPLQQVKGAKLKLSASPTYTESLVLAAAGILALCMITMGAAITLTENIRKYFLRPVRNITETIQELGKGNLEKRVDTGNCVAEMKQIGDNLNQMSEEIQTLKIKVYEEELERKDAEFQLYSAQIRPHFILNMINAVYNMTSLEEYGNVLKTCRYLSSYMRYLFTEKELICTLDQEILHLKEYINLQEARYPGALECRLELEAQILECIIPTLSVHTLVENIFKYAMGDQEILKILIRGDYDAKENRVFLQISDNGNGFSEEILNSVKAEEERHTERKIGLRNTVKRFRQLYGDEFTFVLRNEDGAVIEMYFPFRNESKKEVTPK